MKLNEENIIFSILNQIEFKYFILSQLSQENLGNSHLCRKIFLQKTGKKNIFRQDQSESTEACPSQAATASQVWSSCLIKGAGVVGKADSYLENSSIKYTISYCKSVFLVVNSYVSAHTNS